MGMTETVTATEAEEERVTSGDGKNQGGRESHRRLRAGQSLDGRGNYRGVWLGPRHPGRTPLSRVYGL